MSHVAFSFLHFFKVVADGFIRVVIAAEIWGFNVFEVKAQQSSGQLIVDWVSKRVEELLRYSIVGLIRLIEQPERIRQLVGYVAFFAVNPLTTKVNQVIACLIANKYINYTVFIFIFFNLFLKLLLQLAGYLTIQGRRVSSFKN